MTAYILVFPYKRTLQLPSVTGIPFLEPGIIESSIRSDFLVQNRGEIRPENISSELFDRTYRMSETDWSKIPCPRCQSDSGLQIVYGPPTEDLFLHARKGRLFLGGKPLGRDNRHCVECGFDWNDTRTSLMVTEF